MCPHLIINESLHNGLNENIIGINILETLIVLKVTK